MTNAFYFYKSQGDVVYSLPAIQSFGGGIIYTGLPIEQYKALKPLIIIQPGIEDFIHESEYGIPKGFINLEEFRYKQRNPVHICDTFAETLGVNINYKNGWLELPVNRAPNHTFAAINITPRYRDKVFSYKKELAFLRKNTERPIQFLGSGSEYHAFKTKYGEHRVQYNYTKDFLQAAFVIQAAKFYTGTQSACLAIRQGLGLPYRYERSPFFDNTMQDKLGEYIINARTRKWHFFLSYTSAAIKNFKK